ncbi:hypothetical protein [Sorangium cellulosum]|nr:hypothetical protein [Sorangium cellulosum]
MAKVSPVYSNNPNSKKVYHNNDKCTEINNIERENLRNGTDNRPLCEHCARLNAQGK